MGVREYDSTTGRFNSTDVLQGKKANPQDRNRYPYAFNSPLRFFDLDGREEEESFWDNLDPRNWFDDDEDEGGGEEIQPPEEDLGAVVAGTAAAAAEGAGAIAVPAVGGTAVAAGGAAVAVAAEGVIIVTGLPYVDENVENVRAANKCVTDSSIEGVHVWGPQGIQINYSTRHKHVDQRLADRLGIPREKLRDAIHTIKHRAGLKGNDNVEIDENGEVYPEGSDESIGNVHDEYYK